LLDAIERSCNVYFYKLGLKVGIEDWSAFSKELFFGEPTGIDLVEEKSGLLPDIRYFDNKFGAGKTPKGTALNLAIGQGDLLVTPLQMVRLAMIIANEGIYPKLHLVRYIEDPIEQEKWWTKIDSMRTKNISRNTYALLKLGMYRAVHGPKGTAVTAYCQDLEVAGKTGTAQNPHGQPHSWFIGFAPCTRPEIAICVLVENGGSGSRTAAPIAKKLIEEYFNMKNFAHARL
jgi:penicillin-binding protein 2